MTNKEVAQAWASGRKANTLNIMSTGNSLFSYEAEIARTVDGKHYITTKKYSNTTNRHTSLARQAAERYEDTDEF